MGRYHSSFFCYRYFFTSISPIVYFNIDYIIIDTGPGLRMDVANAVMISDVIGLILKPTLSDLEGTKRMVMAMLQNYAKDKAKGLILNRALQKSWQSGAATVPEANNEYEDLVYNIRQFSEDTSTSIYSILPCLCDVSRAQSDRILVLDYPDHPFCGRFVCVYCLARDQNRRSER